jgi:GT2 family glycosyltransferase
MILFASPETVCAVVINWNGWRDTTACVQSLLDLDDAPLHIVLCDNASTDSSMAQLHAWLDAHGSLRGDTGDAMTWRTKGPRAHGAVRIRLLPLDENLGYAGGINAGIDWAQAHWHQSFFWLLNNDVEARPGALRALLDAHRRVPGAGICGSVLLDWDHPERVQAVAGIYRRWLGVGFHATSLPAAGGEVCLDLDYPVGASMLVTQDYLRQVGPIEASYFLYYEEMDWVERGRRHGYRPVVALGSRLRHKEGASTGSRGGVRHKSLLSERYGVINRLRITRRFWPWYLPLVWLSLLAVAGDRIVHREFARAALVLRLMFSPRLWLA